MFNHSKIPKKWKNYLKFWVPVDWQKKISKIAIFWESCTDTDEA